MSKGNTFENDLLQLVFNNVAASLIGDAAGLQPSAGAGSLYLSLHTADPGEAGTQATNETAYTNYARIAVARTVGGWTVSGNSVTNAALAAFAQCGVTGATVTHFGVGTAASGAGKLLYSAALTASRSIADGDTPQFAATSLTVTED